MPRPLPVTIIDALTSETTGEAFLILLEIRHPNIDTIRLVRNTQNVVSNGETYIAFPFSAVLPADSEDVQPVIRLQAQDAVSEIVTPLRQLAGSTARASGDLRVIAASDPDTYLAEFVDHEISNATYAAGQVSIDMGQETFLTEGFPGDTFSPGGFPAIF